LRFGLAEENFSPIPSIPVAMPNPFTGGFSLNNPQTKPLIPGKLQKRQQNPRVRVQRPVSLYRAILHYTAVKPQMKWHQSGNRL
jgi:hypothetical protein